MSTKILGGWTHSHVQHRVMLPFSWATTDILTHAVSQNSRDAQKPCCSLLLVWETLVSELRVTFFPGQRRASVASASTCLHGKDHWICCVTPLSSASHSSLVVHLRGALTKLVCLIISLFSHGLIDIWCPITGHV